MVLDPGHMGAAGDLRGTSAAAVFTHHPLKDRRHAEPTTCF